MVAVDVQADKARANGNLWEIQHSGKVTQRTSYDTEVLERVDSYPTKNKGHLSGRQYELMVEE